MIRFKTNDTRFYEDQKFGFDASRYIVWRHEWYVAHNDFERSLRALDENEFRCEPYTTNVWTADSDEDTNGKSFMLMCWGGIGDLVSMTPIFRSLKQDYGFRQVVLSAPGMHKGWFSGYVDYVVSYPSMQTRVEACDYVYLIEDILDEMMKRNLTDIFIDKLKLNIPIEDRYPFLEINLDAVEYVKGLLPPRRGKYVALHFQGSVPERCIPIGKAVAMANRIADEGHTALLLGKWPDLSSFEYDDLGDKTSVRSFRPGVYNMCGLLENQDEIAALLSMSDYFIGPDSGLMHIAGALGIPGSAVFTGYHSSVRIGYYPSIVGIDVDEKYYTSNRDTFFPKEQQRQLYEEAVETIDWEAIVRAAIE